MKLEHPLAGLIHRCETICEAACCGIGAYDFSPIHIASYLILWVGKVDQSAVAKVREQVLSLRDNFGANGLLACGVTIDQMNQKMTGAEVDAFASMLLSRVDAALELIAWQASRQDS